MIGTDMEIALPGLQGTIFLQIDFNWLNYEHLESI